MSELDGIIVLAERTIRLVVVDQVSLLILEILSGQGIMTVDRIDRSDILREASSVSIRITKRTRGLRMGVDQTTRSTERKPRTDIVGEVRTDGIALISRLDHVPRLIQIPEGEVRLEISGTKTSAERIVTTVSRTVDGIIPVEVISIEQACDLWI